MYGRVFRHVTSDSDEGVPIRSPIIHGLTDPRNLQIVIAKPIGLFTMYSFVCRHSEVYFAIRTDQSYRCYSSLHHTHKDVNGHRTGCKKVVECRSVTGVVQMPCSISTGAPSPRSSLPRGRGQKPESFCPHNLYGQKGRSHGLPLLYR